MTILLQEVFRKASLLPDEVQDMLAEELLREVERKAKWNSTFGKSLSTSDKMILEAMKKEKSESENLIQSADLYAEIYEEDSELQELTETALQEWPE